MPRLALGFVLVLVSPPLALAQPVSTHAREAVQTIRELRAIGLPDPDDLANGPPAKVPGLLRRLNQALKQLVIETLNDGARRGAPSEEEITEQLRTAGWDEVPDHKWNAYGEIVAIKFDWKIGYEPGILIVTTQLWIPCGSSDPDTAVYVFQGRARQWALVLAADADFDRLQVSQQSGLQSEISPPDDHGKWFLAVAHAPPSCRRSASELHYKLLRPGHSPDEPVTILDRRDLVDPRFEPPFALRVEEDWFALTRGKHRKLDGEWGISIARYEVNDLQVQRTHPLALSPEDFLDEWVQLTWVDASRWAREPKSLSLQHWHSVLNALESDSTEIRVVQRCPVQDGSGDSWLIELWIDRQMNPAVKEEYLYIQVSKEVGIYNIDGIQTTRTAGCPGNTPPPKLADWSLPTW